MSGAKKYYLYLTPQANKRYSQKFVPQGEKERGVRGGVIYVVRKFPVLYHATLDELVAALGTSDLLRLVNRLANEEQQRLLDHKGALMMHRPHGACAQAAAEALGIGPRVAALPAFGRACLEINALAVIATEGRWALTRIKATGGDKLKEIALEEKDFDLAFYQRTFGDGNLVSALSLVAEHFWVWFDQEIAAVKASPEGARYLPLMANKTTMQDSPLPAGDFAGEVLAHRLAVKAVETTDAGRRQTCEAMAAWFAVSPAFRRAVLELHLCAITPMKKLTGINALLLPSTAAFYETYFGKTATGAAFACETFRAMFEAELATDFIRKTFSKEELAVLRKFIRRAGLPKGEEVGLHLLNLLKRDIDLLKVGHSDAAQVQKIVAGHESLIAKVLPLTLLQRLTLSVYLLVD